MVLLRWVVRIVGLHEYVGLSSMRSRTIDSLPIALISATHKHIRRPTQRIRKIYRLLFRLAVAIVWVCLPLAKGLNSLDLIGTTAAMTALVLAVDIYGMSCTDDPFFSMAERTYEPKLLDGETDGKSMTSSDKENEFMKYVCRNAG